MSYPLLAPPEAPAIGDVIDRAGDLQVLPEAARKVIAMVRGANTSAAELQAVIEHDPSFATTVLKIANSAFYGQSRAVSSLQQAIVVLGFQTLRNLVVAASAKALYSHFGAAEKMLWAHSMGVAAASRLVVEKAGRRGCDLSFLGGLLHDVGKVVLLGQSPEIYVDVLRRAADGERAHTVERELYGYSHAEVGAGVLASWGLPQNIVDLVAHHHDWEDGSQATPDVSLDTALATVSLADHICRFHGIGCAKPMAELEVAAARAVGVLGLGERAVAELVAEAPAAIERDSQLFG